MSSRTDFPQYKENSCYLGVTAQNIAHMSPSIREQDQNNNQNMDMGLEANIKSIATFKQRSMR